MVSSGPFLLIGITNSDFFSLFIFFLLRSSNPLNAANPLNYLFCSPPSPPKLMPPLTLVDYFYSVKSYELSYYPLGLGFLNKFRIPSYII